MDVPPGSAITTPNEMLAEIRAVHRGVEAIGGDLKRLAGHVEQVLPDHEERLRKLEKAQGDVDKDVPDHEERIRTLERWRWGLAGVVGPISGGIGAAITKLIGG